MFSKKILNIAFKSTKTTFKRPSSFPVYQNFKNYFAIQTSTTSSNKNNHSENNNSSSKNSHNEYTNNFYYAAILPLFAIMTDRVTKVSCLFGSSKPEPNQIKNRIALIQYPSNRPIEDRWAVYQLEAISGFVVMVFDGHLGWQVAEYAKEQLPKILDSVLKANKERKFANDDEYITTSIKEAFDQVENNFLEFAKTAYNLGFSGAGNAGACALVSVVYGNKVYAANAGDCKGVICKEDNGQVSLRKINHKLNANSKKEQARLKREFTDSDIYVCAKDEPDACYVKNRLQPTRSFGDFYLKYAEFNNPKALDNDHGYRKAITDFKGPYMTHVPEIKIFELETNDRYLILSTDGMWDELKNDDVAKIVQKNIKDKQKLTTELLETALATAAKRINFTEKQLKDIPTGKRRDYHDDMTILVVDLANQRQ